MLCKECRKQLGPSEKYISAALRQWDTKGDRALEMVKQKIIVFLEGDRSVVYDLKDRLEEVESRLNKLEDKK